MVVLIYFRRGESMSFMVEAVADNTSVTLAIVAAAFNGESI